MAWTHNPSDTLTQSTAIERWRALILMLNGRGDITTNQGGWVSGTGGRTGTELVFQLSYVDAINTTKTRHMTIMFDDYSTNGILGMLKPNPAYDPAASPDTADAYAMTIEPQYDGGGWKWEDNIEVDSGDNQQYPWTIWFSDQDPAAWMVIENGIVLGILPSQVSRTSPVYKEDYITTGSTARAGMVTYGLAAPEFSATNYFWRGYGYPGEAEGGSSGGAQAAIYGEYSTPENSWLMYKNIPNLYNSAYYGMYANDIGFYLPPNSQMTEALPKSFAHPCKVVYAEDQYWMQISGINEGYSSWLLSTGAIDPTPALFPS